jgi:hypothetical protein
MNFKSIATFGLVAVALAATSINSAQASNNNSRYANELARQYYLQNQAAAGNAAFSNQALAAANNAAFTNQAMAAANNAALNNQAVAAANNIALSNQALAAASLANGALTPTYGAISPAFTTVTPAYGTVSPLSIGAVQYGTAGFASNGAVAAEMNLLNQQIVKLQGQLAMSNNPNQAIKIENKIAMIQTAENNLATTGSPYGTNGGFINNLSGFLPRF